MKRIQCLKDFNIIEETFPIPTDFFEYLKNEFRSLYEYLSNGEEMKDFILLPHQAIIILDNKKELMGFLKQYTNLEFLDEEQWKDVNILRMGVMVYEDVQLYYYCKRDNELES